MSMILVVDDDPSVRFVLRVILEKAGHEVVEAPHGAAALDLIDQERLPDLVMTDLMMPVLDGEELIGRLRSAPTTAAIPIVVVSGNAEAAHTLKASGLVEAVVSKPFQAAVLRETIDAIAGRAGKPPMVAKALRAAVEPVLLPPRLGLADRRRGRRVDEGPDLR